MLNQRAQAYGKLTKSKSNLIKERADITNIGLEQQFSAASSQMNLEDLANKTGAISQFLNLVSAGAGYGMDVAKSQKSIAELGELTGGAAEQIYGEKSFFRSLWEGDWGEAGERLSVLAGIEDPRYKFKGGEFTSSELESFLPYAKTGMKFEEIQNLFSGVSPKVSTKIDKTINRRYPESRWEGTFEDLGMTESDFDNTYSNIKTGNYQPVNPAIKAMMGKLPYPKVDKPHIDTTTEPWYSGTEYERMYNQDYYLE